MYWISQLFFTQLSLKYWLRFLRQIPMEFWCLGALRSNINSARSLLPLTPQNKNAAGTGPFCFFSRSDDASVPFLSLWDYLL